MRANCIRARLLFVESVFRRLDDRKVSRLVEHTSRCWFCRTEFEQTRQEMALLLVQKPHP